MNKASLMFYRWIFRRSFYTQRPRLRRISLYINWGNLFNSFVFFLAWKWVETSTVIPTRTTASIIHPPIYELRQKVSPLLAYLNNNSARINYFSGYHGVEEVTCFPKGGGERTILTSSKCHKLKPNQLSHWNLLYDNRAQISKVNYRKKAPLKIAY